MRKLAVYPTRDGELWIDYDPLAPCILCGYPVKDASAGGTVICPACDMGVNRFTMRPWNWIEHKDVMKNFKLVQDGGEPVKAYYPEMGVI